MTCIAVRIYTKPQLAPFCFYHFVTRDTFFYEKNVV